MQRAREKATTAVFAKFTVRSLSCVKLSSRSNIVCSSPSLVANSTRSSAYKRRGTLRPIISQVQLLRGLCSSRYASKASIKMPNKVGESGQPCLTPTEDEKLGENPDSVSTRSLTSE